jgi:hypothetical protein
MNRALTFATRHSSFEVNRFCCSHFVFFSCVAGINRCRGSSSAECRIGKSEVRGLKCEFRMNGISQGEGAAFTLGKPYCPAVGLLVLEYFNTESFGEPEAEHLFHGEFQFVAPGGQDRCGPGSGADSRSNNSTLFAADNGS